jgi:hypothetical protein
MFIQIGPKRINLSLVKEYREETKESFNRDPYYSVIFTFLDNTREEVHFFKDKDKKDEYIKLLDKNLLSDLS